MQLLALEEEYHETVEEAHRDFNEAISRPGK